MIKYILILFVFCSQIFSTEMFLGVKYNSTSQKNEVYSIDPVSGKSTFLKDFAFPSGFWQPSASFLDSYNGNLYLKDSAGDLIQFNPKDNSVIVIDVEDIDFQSVFQTPWMGKDLIYKNADSGETHIGENSLVTSEVNGQQLLYATDANGAKIDINISNGSDLRINNKSVSGAIAATIAMNQIEIAEEGLSVGVGLGSFAGSNKIAVGLGYAGALNENLNYVLKASTSNNEYGLGVSFNFR